MEEEGVIILPVSPTELYRSEPLKTGYIRTKKNDEINCGVVECDPYVGSL